MIKASNAEHLPASSSDCGKIFTKSKVNGRLSEFWVIFCAEKRRTLPKIFRELGFYQKEPRATAIFGAEITQNSLKRPQKAKTYEKISPIADLPLIGALLGHNWS